MNANLLGSLFLASNELIGVAAGLSAGILLALGIGIFVEIGRAHV